VDDETATLIRAVRPVLKGHIRQTRSLLAYLTRLDERLDALDTDGQEAHGGNTEKQTVRVG